jgi:hypothetical protein
MCPYWHFCGMAAAASLPPSPGLPGTNGHRGHFLGAGPMHRLPARDSKGMDVFGHPQDRR